MFYEMLTGQRPYGGRSAVAIMSQHASRPVPVCPRPRQRNNPARSPHGEAAKRRYASADELLADLGPLWRLSPESPV